ncbi:Ycf51 family protein [Synechococcus sp. PCC 7336]|uniref:Ycf51 family protein n=1 Tax=Synechococcus sp. PCC 7336 TaxID=195250 RepID=UPI0003467028|nr:Ycf51 family protein [Synechococcus sp. PCC 7336]
MDPSLFATASRYCLILAGILAVATVVLWIRQTKYRFAFFGYTAFTIVLSVGLAALSFGPIIRTTVPGAAPFTTVYDNGSARAAIAVGADISPEQLELTLLQAAKNLFSSGRYSANTSTLTIRARTIVHPEPGVSLPIYLGQVRQSMAVRSDPNIDIEIFSEGFEELNEYTSVEAG